MKGIHKIDNYWCKRGEEIEEEEGRERNNKTIEPLEHQVDTSSAQPSQLESSTLLVRLRKDQIEDII